MIERRGALKRDKSELVPLGERMVYLQVLRVAFVVIVLVTEALRGIPSSEPLSAFATLSAVYLFVEALMEAARRLLPKGGLRVIGTMLLVDGVYLAWVMYATGGTASLLRFLVYIHLIAVTLLASYRTGLKIALWHSLLLFAVFYAQAAEVVRPIDRRIVDFDWSDPVFLRASMLNITALWVVAIGTAWFSSVNEKELRRQKFDLAALADMVERLEIENEPQAISATVLRSVCGAFRFKRGVMIGMKKGTTTVLARLMAPTEPELSPQPEPILREAWTRRQPLLRRSLDPETDPTIASLLPGARNVVVVPLFADGHPVAVMLLEQGGGFTTRVERKMLNSLSQFATHAGLVLRNAALMQQIRRMADTDALTGLANRRKFERALSQEISRAQRHGETVTLMMMDIDHFKKLNDAHGHQVGDDVLRAAGVTLSERSRPFDIAARYGGEEFAVILPSCTSKESLAVAERFRKSLGEMTSPVGITASAGVATFPTHAGTADALLRAADEALYESKRLGRDRVTRSRRRGMRRPTPKPDVVDLTIDLPPEDVGR
jgi:diguanylate cyclase (GGDEF)-like protein